jgi:hypothetical protein
VNTPKRAIDDLAFDYEASEALGKAQLVSGDDEQSRALQRSFTQAATPSG